MILLLFVVFVFIGRVVMFGWSWMWVSSCVLLMLCLLCVVILRFCLLCSGWVISLLCCVCWCICFVVVLFVLVFGVLLRF